MKNCIECLKKPGKVAAFCLCVTLSLAAQSPSLSVVREIRDSSTGAVWALARNDAYPGGPARWVLMKQGNESASGTERRKLLIHARDRIVVEEHSPIADVRLTAIALEGAAQGEKLRVRMVAGGGVASAWAVSESVGELAAERVQ